MTNIVKHVINLVKHAFRDVAVSAKRSSHWPTVEKHFRESHPTCAACGSSKRLNVHHCMPFHLDPQLELDPNNLITLCMDKKECHLRIGHGGSFKQYNPNVRKMAVEALAKPEKFEEIVKLAFEQRKEN